MKHRWFIPTIVVITIIFGSYLAITHWRALRNNPYIQEGLEIKWTYGGASSAYPSLHISIDYRGKTIRPDLIFGGVEYPRLRFRDLDGDGRRDIVFENDECIQAVAFFSASGDDPPQFKIIRNDVNWP